MTEASLNQRRASNPQSSVWVSASAGTGKTKVLTDRVLSLMLEETKPERILCLTFTKAAAAEMVNRVSLRLSEWAICDEKKLYQEISYLLGKNPTSDQISLARQLFVLLLDSPGGFHIETIHAFCQSLLGRFPLEADLAPHFKLIDERDAKALLLQIQEGVMANLSEKPDLQRAICCLTERLNTEKFSEMMQKMISQRGRLKKLSGFYTEDFNRLEQGLKENLGLDPFETEESVTREACLEKSFDRDSLVKAIGIYRQGKLTDYKKIPMLSLWLSVSTLEERMALFDDYSRIFLKKDRSKILDILMTKPLIDSHRLIYGAIVKEAVRHFLAVKKLKTLETVRFSVALITVAREIIHHYEKEKRRRALLDYDDLILNAGELLSRDGLAGWVLYKLDGGIDHVLVDEAQDTNPDQWSVIHAITSEFFSGIGQSEKNRTIFIVGDAKQSIYSFQRADPREYRKTHHLLAQSVRSANHYWDDVPLITSFRTVPAILKLVDAVFSKGSQASHGVIFDNEPLHHQAFRDNEAGLVELWPLVEKSETEEPESWKLPLGLVKIDNPIVKLAYWIADKIEELLLSQIILPSTKKVITAGDVLILVRKRSTLTAELVRALKNKGIPIAGADRMILTEQMAVMDILALAQCLLLPDDDLTLATVLKSPLIGLGEDDLFTLAYNREGSLWQRLQEKSKTSPFSEILTYLQTLGSHAKKHSCFDFFSSILFTAPPLGDYRTGKEALLSRLGLEALDPLDELMSLALTYETNHAPSLQNFIEWIESSDVEIKRDLDSDKTKMVRIMTVHGSKGLESPIVFLPDTMTFRERVDEIIWFESEETPHFVWPRDSESFDEKSQEVKDSLIEASRAENNRLLYVAMTRAKDHLYICGAKKSRAPLDNSWYFLVKKVMSEIGEAIPDPRLEANDEDEKNYLYRLRDAPLQKNEEKSQNTSSSIALPTELPAWAYQKVLVESQSQRPLFPSQLDSEDEQTDRYKKSPHTEKILERGKLIHRLLEVLPSFPKKLQRKKCQDIVSLRGGIFSDQERESLIDDVIAILHHPEFDYFFGPDSRAEIPITGQIGSQIISGQIDRLVVLEKEVLLIDYKSDRNPPERTQDIPKAYQSQMKAYKNLLQEIYPNKVIKSALLWTQGPTLMWL